MNYTEKQTLHGKLALVTGAGQGIGFACSQALAATGAELICTDMLEEKAKVSAESLREQGYKARHAALDVTNTQQIDALAASLETLDILVCNAGITELVACEDMSDASWEKMMSVNLGGVFRTCRAFGRRMLEKGRGSIIALGSISGSIVNVPQLQTHYNVSKAAVHHLVRCLAVEWAKRGVRVNAVAPSYIETAILRPLLATEQGKVFEKTWRDLTPMGRFGRPDEIASIVQFLASEAASLITGAVIAADGGYTCL